MIFHKRRVRGVWYAAVVACARRLVPRISPRRMMGKRIKNCTRPSWLLPFWYPIWRAVPTDLGIPLPSGADRHARGARDFLSFAALKSRRFGGC